MRRQAEKVGSSFIIHINTHRQTHTHKYRVSDCGIFTCSSQWMQWAAAADSLKGCPPEGGEEMEDSQLIE